MILEGGTEHVQRMKMRGVLNQFSTGEVGFQ